MRCVALEEQQSLRDLAQLPNLADELVWIPAGKLPTELGLAVICALWLQDGGQATADLLRERSKAGLATLVVPRFKAGDLAKLLGAPTAIEVKAGDFCEIVWTDQCSYAVSGVSHFKTSLHAGNWAKAGDGNTVILSYRSYATSGPVVLCSAALTSRPLGISFDEQQRLFGEIVKSVTAMGIASISAESVELRDVGPLEVDSFLDEFGEQGASLLLALVASDGNREANLTVTAQQAIGLHLSKETLGLLNKLELTPLQGIETALRNYGWGAYLRRIRAIAQSRG